MVEEGSGTGILIAKLNFNVVEKQLRVFLSGCRRKLCLPEMENKRENNDKIAIHFSLL